MTAHLARLSGPLVGAVVYQHSDLVLSLPSRPCIHLVALLADHAVTAAEDSHGL